MKKFEYVSESSKTCVVVLKDHWGNTLAKGMSRCSEDDTFSREAGLKLANARAWKKYFDNTIKSVEQIEKHLGIPVIGTVPSVGKKGN